MIQGPGLDPSMLNRLDQAAPKAGAAGLGAPGIGALQPGGPGKAQPGNLTEGGQAFQDLLSDKIQGLNPQAANPPPSSLKFSGHAVDRMRSRGISLAPTDMTRIEQAVQKAQAKGSKETLILMDKAALIVNVKNNTVVTAMDRNSMKENVFTNIDSTVVL